MKIEPGTVWTHYKGNKYVVVSLARLETHVQPSDGQDLYEGTVLVIYRPYQMDCLTFARPVSEWLENIADGRTDKKRMRFEFCASDVGRLREAESMV